MGILARIISSVLIISIGAVVDVLINVPATLALGQIAGKQFEASDTSYLAAQAAFRVFNGLAFFIAAMVILGLALIWAGPIKRAIASILALAAFFIFLPHQASAYYNQSDYTENYFILPNESAFFIPDVGDNKSSQAAFGSEQYLTEHKIAAKRFEIPHTKLPNSGLWSNYYVPAGRLIVVDRTPVSREWVKSPHRGTAAGDQSFPCQSSEGLDMTVGVAIGASVYEENAPKFLFRFGVNPPTGDRNDPNVVFTSVYRGKSLAEVMDGPVRSRVQALVCDEVSARSLGDDNAQAAKIMDDIKKKVTDYMASVGITLDFIGWADTFQFNEDVQSAINRRYIATQDVEVSKTMAPYTGTLQALATAEGTRRVAEKWNGQLPSSVSLWWLPSSIGEWIGKTLAPAK